MEGPVPTSDREPSIRLLLHEAKRDLAPYERLPAARRAAIGGGCGADEIAELIAWLDDLSRAFEALPDWDGDSQDDIAQAQDTLGAILGQVPRAHFGAVAAGLGSPAWRTRVHVVRALLTLDRGRALPILHGAIAREADAAARQIMARMLAETVSGGP